MKYDFEAFLLGASLAAGRVFWVGQGGTSNVTIGKSDKNYNIYTGLSADGKIAIMKVNKQ